MSESEAVAAAVEAAGPPIWYYLIAAVAVVLALYFYGVSQEPEPREPESKRIPEYSARHPPNPHRVFSKAELAHYNGKNDETSPIYLACKGVVYDVTYGESFYGPGAGYQHLAGCDGSRSLARMDVNERGEGLEGLSRSELSTLDEWEAHFDMKYPRVGVLNGTAAHRRSQAEQEAQRNGTADSQQQRTRRRSGDAGSAASAVNPTGAMPSAVPSGPPLEGKKSD